MWSSSAIVVPVVIGALGSVSRDFEESLHLLAWRSGLYLTVVEEITTMLFTSTVTFVPCSTYKLQCKLMHIANILLEQYTVTEAKILALHKQANINKIVYSTEW